MMISMETLDGAVFVDAGTVAARVGDLGLDRTVYGFGLRLHTEKSTMARLDVAHTGEGWRVMFRTSDPFNLDRLTRWTAAVPFVPLELLWSFTSCRSRSAIV